MAEHAPGRSALPYFDLLFDARAERDGVATIYDRYVHWGYWSDPRAVALDGDAFAAAMANLDAQVRTAAAIADGHAVLDVGCGFGGSLRAAAATVRDAMLVGVNIDARQLEVARSQVTEASFVHADGCALPFRDASFDRILAVECVFHFASRLRFLREAARVLRPGGRIALSDFVARSAVWTRGALVRALERRIESGYGPLGNRWPDGEYPALARAAGLTIVLDRDVTAHTQPTYQALLTLLHRHLEAPAVRKMIGPTRLLQWVSRLGLVRYRIITMEKHVCYPPPA